jgi:murein DD-endopeptidase MepM/ murein hydrolase activator NlpD
MTPARDERPLVDAWLQSGGRASARRVADWLVANTSAFAPVLGIDVRREPCLVLDFTASSPLLRPPDSDNGEPALTARIRDAMRAARVRLAVGRYDELRPPYESTESAKRDPDRDPRVVHLGVDLFAEPGMTVPAPIAATVHDAGESRSALGYGPTVVLRHETSDGTPFFTLYGHLGREALSLCTPGRRVPPGTNIGRIGTTDVNGGWTPHLHFQVITDLLGLGRRFPGVGRSSQRDAWRWLSPNPNLVLGIPVLS